MCKPNVRRQNWIKRIKYWVFNEQSHKSFALKTFRKPNRKYTQKVYPKKNFIFHINLLILKMMIETCRFCRSSNVPTYLYMYKVKCNLKVLRGVTSKRHYTQVPGTTHTTTPHRRLFYSWSTILHNVMHIVVVHSYTDEYTLHIFIFQ